MLVRFLNWLSDLRPRQLLILSGIAAAVMFAIAYGAFSMLQKEIQEEQQPTTKELPAIAMKSVVVAKSNIASKTILKQNMLQLKELPENIVPPNAVTDMAVVLNKMTKTAIYSGDVLTEQKVFQSQEQSGFVGTIPPNCRAVSVSVNDVTGVAGFAKPGDYVDVMLVEKVNKTVTSSILLQNVLLLSINKNMGVNRNSDDENAVDSDTQAIENPSIATLALSPEDVLKLVSASKLGEVYLMLRPFKPDSLYVPDGEFTFRPIKTEETQKPAPEKSTPAPEKPAPAPEQPAPVVEKKEVEQPKIEIIYGNAPPKESGNKETSK